MNRPPTIVSVPLGAIAVTGVLFAVTTALDGALGVSAFYLLLPLTALGCLRGLKHARTAMFIAALVALGPLFVGVLLTWPDARSGVPYIVSAAAVVGGLGGMLTKTARAWHASERARGLLDC